MTVDGNDVVQDVKIHLVGDVNEDGGVNYADIQLRQYKYIAGEFHELQVE